jgi:transcriptional regulator with XRE-family HTH domain
MPKRVSQKLLADCKVEIARRVRTVRDERGWTQEDVAALLGCSRTKMNRIENGRAELTGSELAALARTFKVPVEAFFAG